MSSYQVYMYNVPRVSEDQKVIPVGPNRRQEFSDREEAGECAAEHNSQFDRVVLMQVSDSDQQLIERYTDGELIIPEIADAGEGRNDKPR